MSSYVLGADAGACLGASIYSSQEIKKTSITFNVKVLWSYYTTSRSTTDTSEKIDVDLTYCGYDALNAMSLSLHAQSGESTHEIRAAASRYMAMANALQQRLSTGLQELGITQNRTATAEQCFAAIDSGVVVELILVPFKTLRDYIEVSTGTLKAVWYFQWTRLGHCTEEQSSSIIQEFDNGY